MSSNVVTRVSKQPFSPSLDIVPLDVSMTWLLKTLNKDTLQSDFHIDREKVTCRTPRNNDDINQAWKFFTDIRQWSNRVDQYFNEKDRQIFEKANRNEARLRSINGDGIFIPVLPLFGTPDDTNQSPIISSEEVNLFLNKQVLTMTESIESMKKHFCGGQTMSPVEAIIVLLTKHSSSIVEFYFDSLCHIEDMLCTQLHDAVGKHLSNDDLDDFVRSYNRKLFADTYIPEPFCYAIRRLDHYPDGLITIEEDHSSNGKNNNNGSERNALTFTRQLETRCGDNQMYIPINSATSVNFTGNLFLHAWMMQRFQHFQPSFKLTSRARQFSSFLLLVGKLSCPDIFEPEHGIILKNQDEVLIPLLLEEMPSAKEFKDAIDSLSPEQQDFAKAIRDIKLSSSVFGVCVVQLKPQLEMLLGLPDKSLTKEIRLTESLLSLFIDYQIPSDLLSFDGEDDLDAAAKVGVVKGHVKKVEEMIDDLKERDLKKTRLEADMCNELLSQHEKVEHEKHRIEDNLFIGEGMMRSMDSINGAFDTVGIACDNSFKKKGRYGMKNFRMKSMQKASSKSMTSLFNGYERAMNISLGSAPSPPSATFLESIQSKNSPESAYIAKNFTENLSKTNPRNNNGNNNDEIADVNQNIDVDHDDLTNIPRLFDSKFENFGDQNYVGAVRSSTIKAGGRWTINRKQNILSKSESFFLYQNEQKTERQKAFDLLDALSRSGVLPMSHAELHVIVASTHCFDKSVVNTVVQDNVNPIEKIERSLLMMASVIHSVGIKELLADADDLVRISNHSPMLTIDNDAKGVNTL